jgi:hypothetical protein
MSPVHGVDIEVGDKTTDDRPQSAVQEIAQNQTYEEGHKRPICLGAKIAQNERLDRPCNHEGQPSFVHRFGVGDSVTEWVQG